MANKELQAIILKARGNFKEDVLDVSRALRFNNTSALCEDLRFLDKALWTLAHIIALNLFPLEKIELEARVSQEIKNILHNHPQIQQIIIPSETGINPKIFTESLVKNIPIDLRPQEFFAFLNSWLERKAVHAIIGDRADELEFLFGDKLVFAELLNELADKHKVAREKLTEKDEEVDEDYERLKAVHEAEQYSSLEYRRPGETNKRWLEFSKIEELYKSWQGYYSEFNPNLEKRQQDYKRLFNTSGVKQARIAKLGDYIGQHLDNGCKEYFIRQAKLTPQSKEVASLLEESLLLNTNQVLFASYDRPTISLPLRLAFKHHNITSFKGLLDIGANPFISEYFYKEILGSSNGKKYLLAIIDYFKAFKEQQARWQIESRKLEFNLPAEIVLECSEETIKALNEIYNILANYFVERFPERVNPTALTAFLSLVSGRKFLQLLTHTSTRDRALELFHCINLFYSRHSPENFKLEQVAKNLRDILQKSRAGIFAKSKEEHFLYKVLKALDTLLQSQELTSENKKQAFEDAQKLHAERVAIDEAINKQKKAHAE